jgi:DNA modification methylase
MKTIDITAIKIAPSRQRRAFDPAKLQELSDGIVKRGLLHPIILRESEGQLFLVAGERRLRAITDIYGLEGSFSHDGAAVPANHIPYTLLADLDPLAVEEAELEENTHRDDLTWQERAAACARIASLRTRQADARGDAPPTTADIALEIRGSSEGVNQEITRREIIVARHLDNPEVKAAKSVGDAFKILRRQEATAKHRALGDSVGRTFTADVHQALNEDSLAWMRECKAEVFDVILTDPPYGMGADEFGDSGGIAAGAHGYADTPELYEQILSVCEQELFRLAKPQAHLYWFCDIDKFIDTRTRFAAVGWQVFRTPLLWYKKTGARAPWPEHGPQRKYECILYAIKGKRTVLKMAGDVLDFPPDANMGHSAQKPVALYKELLSRSVMPGDAVLDPFMGTGTIFAAAHELKARATGIERDTASYGIAVRRLEELKAQAELGL